MTWLQHYKTMIVYRYRCRDPQTGQEYEENEKWVDGCVTYQCMVDREARKISVATIDVSKYLKIHTDSPPVDKRYSTI
jgi:hypothetical protein